MICIHEMGHYIIGEIVLNKDIHFYIWPGYEIFPDFGEKLMAPWPDSSIAFGIELRKFIPGFDSLDLAIRTDVILKNESYIKLMGSGLNYMLSVLSLIILSLVKPKSYLFWFLVFISLLHIDMLTYTVFPIFFNAKHLYFIGGTDPEPITALIQLGVSKVISVIGVIALSIINFLWLYFVLVNFIESPNKKIKFAPTAPDA